MEGLFTRTSSQAPINLLKSGMRRGPSQTPTGPTCSELQFFWSSGPVRSVLVSGSLTEVSKLINFQWTIKQIFDYTIGDCVKYHKLPLMIWSCDSRVLIVNDQHEYLRSAKPAHTGAWLKIILSK